MSEGEVVGYETVLRQLRRRLRRPALRYAPTDWEERRNLIQIGMVAAWLAWPKYQPGGQSLLSFLYMVGNRKMINSLALWREVPFAPRSGIFDRLTDPADVEAEVVRRVSAEQTLRGLDGYQGGTT